MNTVGELDVCLDVETGCFVLCVSYSIGGAVCSAQGQRTARLVSTHRPYRRDSIDCSGIARRAAKPSVGGRDNGTKRKVAGLATRNLGMLPQWTSPLGAQSESEFARIITKI